MLKTRLFLARVDKFIAVFIINMNVSFASFSVVKSIRIGILEMRSSKRTASWAKLGRDWRKETICVSKREKCSINARS